ncbi:hypothetical protein V8G54_035775 [Vigna mungo]|uniref:Uncharacterized protein n=1 Tax=Vigna mungo TaxID=3915 RepID=A0AAQ3MG24_VIGMU
MRNKTIKRKGKLYRLVLLFVLVQLTPQQTQISFQFANPSESHLRAFISFVPKLHQRFPVMIVEGAFSFQFHALLHQSLTLRRQLLILLNEPLHGLGVHGCFILLKIKHPINKKIKINQLFTNNYRGRKTEKITNSSEFDEIVFLLEFGEEEDALLVELAPQLFGGLKLCEEGFIRYGKAHNVVDGLLDVTIDLWRKIHCCCSKSKVGLRLRKKAMPPKPQYLRIVYWEFERV